MTYIGTAMTTYEKIAIAISVAAFLVPIIQWGYKKFIVRPILRFLPTGRALLYINTSGSYIRLYGVLESLNKSVSIKKMGMDITNEHSKTMHFDWSESISPYNQSVLGYYTQTVGSVYPFKINADEIQLAFIEYINHESVRKDEISQSIKQSINAFNIANCAEMKQSYEDAEYLYRALSEYKTAVETVDKYCFWKIGEYNIELVVEYDFDIKRNKNKVKKFNYHFRIDEETEGIINHNKEELICAPLKHLYGINDVMEAVEVRIVE